MKIFEKTEVFSCDTDAPRTERITLWGVVQGVGFRPFVAKSAQRLGLSGEVRNAGGLAQIVLTDTEARIGDFLRLLQEELPPPAEIVRCERRVLPTRLKFTGFSITESAAGDDETSMLPADLPVCEHCLAELRDPANPRFLHPFISCMSCGPRYTIIDRVPYDRQNTSMAEFRMCALCAGQYGDPGDRRYHAQTISCHDCGPMLIFKGKGRGAVKGRKATDAGRGAEVLSSAASAAVSAAAGVRPAPPVSPAARVLGTGVRNGAPVPKHILSKVFAPLARAEDAILTGGVVALKGIGGYYFVCSPFDAAAVLRLREIKVREEKPFAVMFADTDAVRAHCRVNADEEALLSSRARPIVLLKRRDAFAAEWGEGGGESAAGESAGAERKPAGEAAAGETAGADMRAYMPAGESGAERKSAGESAGESAGARAISPEVYRSSRYMGAFLPAMGLQYLLTEDLGPLIMTSANLSDMPMIKDDGEMLRLLRRQPLIAGVLYNKRVIRARMDDSVARIADGRAQMIRRSKGYVPSPIFAEGAEGLTKDDMIWATGGQLKSAFALTKGNAVYVSRFFGDLDTTEAEEAYRAGLARRRTLFRIAPRAVVCDLHPLYATTRMAEEYAARAAASAARAARAPGCGDMPAPRGLPAAGEGIALLRVQHHHAHIASVMAEHGLRGPVIGVAFDGTGYGTDGNIWGGEFLLCEGASFRRMAHLRSVRMIGGDASVKEAWKSALCYAYALGAAGADRADTGAGDPAAGAAPPEILSADLSEILAYSNITEHPLRDQVFAALRSGVNAVESSSAGRLFDAAAALLGLGEVNRYEGECAILLENAAERALSAPGKSRRDDLALRFHRDLAAVILRACSRIREGTGVSTVALSGGVFQNRVLTDEALRLLRKAGFSAYCNIAVPPNDGGISLGQAYIGMKHIENAVASAVVCGD
jgi:hydrogenase maturation protein HypF